MIQWDFSQECENSLTYKNQSMLHTILIEKEYKTEPIMVISIDAEKTLGKIQQNALLKK